MVNPVIRDNRFYGIDFTGRPTNHNVMYYVYVLHSLKDERLYTGFTANLDERLNEHNRGCNQSTKNRRPFTLIYSEYYINKIDAINREKFLKSGSGKTYLKKQLKHYFTEHPWKT